jgi:pumilio RNA-binding family
MAQEDSYQRDMDRQTASHNSSESLCSSGIQYGLNRGPGTIGGLHSSNSLRSLDEIPNNDLPSNTFASLLGSSLSRSASPDPELVRRAPSPSLPPIGVKVGNTDKMNGGSSSFRRSSSAIGGSDDLVAALSGMNLSSRAMSGQTMDQSQLYQDVDNVQKFLFDRQGDQPNGNQQHYMRRLEHGQSKLSDGYSANLANSSTMRNQINSGSFTSFDSLSLGSGFPSPRIGSRSPGGTVSSRQNLAGMSNMLNYNGIGSPTASPSLQTSIDPAYIQYLAQIAATWDDPLMDRSHLGNSYMDLLGTQKANLGPLLQSQKQYGYCGNLGFNLGGYAGSPLASPVLPSSPIAPGSPLRHGDRNMRFPPGMRNFGNSFGSWNSGMSGKMDANLMPSLLEEFKSNKSKSYELSEIAGHVVEFRYTPSPLMFLES